MKCTEPLILCVDDESPYLRSLERTLARHGYRVLACASASDALETVSKVRPALAVVDIMMPGMDGLELTHRLSHWDGGPIPVVLLTGLVSEETRYRGFAEGASYLVEKPCEPARLLEVVDYFAGDLDAEARRKLKERL
jgi:two-component system OmpR family response regulator